MAGFGAAGLVLGSILGGSAALAAVRFGAISLAPWQGGPMGFTTARGKVVLRLIFSFAWSRLFGRWVAFTKSQIRAIVGIGLGTLAMLLILLIVTAVIANHT
jgi:hypothetical protein